MGIECYFRYCSNPKPCGSVVEMGVVDLHQYIFFSYPHQLKLEVSVAYGAVTRIEFSSYQPMRVSPEGYFFMEFPTCGCGSGWCRIWVHVFRLVLT